MALGPIIQQCAIDVERDRLPYLANRQPQIWRICSSVAEPSELGQGSAHSAHSAREDVAHKSTIPCGLKLFCALQICHDKYPPPVTLLQAA